MKLRGATRSVTVFAVSFACLFALAALAWAQDEAGLLKKLDAMTQARYDHVAGFTDTEHYVVYRGGDFSHPAAEMTVQVTYRKGSGKQYKLVSQSGSELIQRFGLKPLLDNEREISDPAKVSDSWFTTANYEMHVQPGQTRVLEGRTCVAVSIKAKHRAPNLLNGTAWVDPGNGAILEVEGTGSKAPSMFMGPTHMMRLYAMMNGYAQATHARAESSGMLGKSVMTIDYTDYRIEMK